MILFDAIFQGPAISLMAGEVASLLLSRVTVPVSYYLSARVARDTTRSSADHHAPDLVNPTLAD